MEFKTMIDVSFSAIDEGAAVSWPHSTMVFSGGEVQVRMAETPVDLRNQSVRITAILRNAAEIMELLLVTDAVRRKLEVWTEHPEIHLVCPYFPYARQDRVCAPGEAFSLEVMAHLINAAHYTSVEVWDVHSHVTLAKLDRCINVTADVLIPQFAIKNDIIVAPDKGAVERATLVARRFGRPMVLAEKDRDPSNGKITRTYLPHRRDENGVWITDPRLDDEINLRSDVDFFIADDICDGGATFIELAKVLRPLTTGKIKLWVTHGIFFKGFDVFAGLIDEIYTANCYRSDVPDFVHVGFNDNLN